MAAKLTQEQVDECREIFDLFDSDEDGRIAAGELVTALRSLGQNVDEAEARRFLADATASGGGGGGGGDIDFAAFLSVAARKMRRGATEKELAACLDVFDDARSGVIPAEQLRQAMVSHGDRLTEEEADGAEWFTTACDASSATGGVAMRDTELELAQPPCQGGQTWTTSESSLPGLTFPDLAVADFEIGGFDVDSFWTSMEDDQLWCPTQAAV